VGAEEGGRSAFGRGGGGTLGIEIFGYYGYQKMPSFYQPKKLKTNFQYSFF
jgi:hypothetical protein